MKIEVAGKRYQGFVGATASMRVDALCNTFSFEATASGAVSLPFTVGDSCVIYVDDEKIITGSIELLNIDGGSDTHRITVQGRDITGDLLDSSIGSMSDLQPPISLLTVCQKVIAHIGGDIEAGDEIIAPFSLATPVIKVVDEANTGITSSLFIETIDRLSPEPGQNAFEFLNKLARKRQIILSSNPDGALLLRNQNHVTVDARIIHRVSDNENNVLAYAMSYDTTGRFNTYKSQSQINVLTLGGAAITGFDLLVNQAGSVTDADIRRGRQFVLNSESPFGGTENDDRIKWEANVRRARGRTYSATVSGFRTQSGALWAPNTLVRVEDEYVKINARMLVNTVEFGLDASGGRKTVLGLIDKDAYKLTLAEPIEEEFGFG